ncbi:MAG: hypothetical protein ACR2OA_22190 [Rubripirellula sp.]
MEHPDAKNNTKVKDNTTMIEEADAYGIGPPDGGTRCICLRDEFFAFGITILLLEEEIVKITVCGDFAGHLCWRQCVALANSNWKKV